MVFWERNQLHVKLLIHKAYFTIQKSFVIYLNCAWLWHVYRIIATNYYIRIRNNTRVIKRIPTPHLLCGINPIPYSLLHKRFQSLVTKANYARNSSPVYIAVIVESRVRSLISHISEGHIFNHLGVCYYEGISSLLPCSVTLIKSRGWIVKGIEFAGSAIIKLIT